MIPRNLFPPKVSTAAFLQDIIRLTNVLSENPSIDRILILVDEDYTARFGGEPLTAPLCEMVSPGTVTEAWLGGFNPRRTHVIFALECASDGLPVLARIVAAGFKFSPAGGAPVGSYAYENRTALETIESQFIHQISQGYAKFEDPGTVEDFANLCQALETTRNLPGDIVEIGCFRGSSGSILLDYARRAGLVRRFHFFDTFDGFAYEDARTSSDAMWQNTHATEGQAAITKRLMLIAGNSLNIDVYTANIITDSLPVSITQIAVANVDVDLYEAVKAGLDKVAPLIVPGGLIICEDAGHTPNLIGARLALEEFRRSAVGARFTTLFMNSGQAFLVAR
jgi:hypothetical protein